MLVVDPGSCMAPVRFSFSVLTTCTLLVTESKTSKVDRSGDIAMRPGELPALISPLDSESIAPSIMIRPASVVELDTLCEASTRVVSPLGGLGTFVPPPPQDTRQNPATTSATDNRADFFKRQAPNCRKTIDLSAK